VGKDPSGDEARLVRRCADGDEEAWTLFVDRYGKLLTALASRMLARRTGRAPDEDVDEVVAEVFLSLLRRDRILLHRYDSRWRLSTYLGVICRTAVVRLLRRRRAVPLDHPEAIVQPGAEALGLEGLTAGEREDALGRLRDGLAALSERDRLLITLKFQDGLEYRAIAQALDVSPESIGPLLHRAKQRLRKHVASLEELLSDES